jgi:hypothetical protein
MCCAHDLRRGGLFGRARACVPWRARTVSATLQSSMKSPQRGAGLSRFFGLAINALRT